MYFFEASKGRRYAQVVCAVVWCLFGAGPIFGFAALKPILIDQGIYSEVCKSHDASVFNVQCTEQDLKLNMMFTVGAALTNVSALVIGASLDHFGPRFCGLVGATFLFLASVVFINRKSIWFFDPVLVGYSLMALGGPFTYISSFQLSNAFPEKSGLILALLTGAFDTSSAVFLLYQKLYAGHRTFFTLETFYKLYLVVPLFIFGAQLFIMPSESYLIPPPELIPDATDAQLAVSRSASMEEQLHHHTEETIAEISETTPLTGIDGEPFRRRKSSLGDAFRSAYVESEIEVQSTSGNVNSIFGVLHGQPASKQFKSLWFVLMCSFATIQMLRLNYFVATVNSQYSYLLGSAERANALNKIFDVALPLGGVVSIPFVGMLLDNVSTFNMMNGLLGVSVLIGVLGVMQNSWVSGVVNVLVFVCYRPFFYTSISDYCAKVFGFETFGVLYGSIMTIAGIFNFLQGPLDMLTHTKFEMNPIPLNLFLLAITVVVGMATVLYIGLQSQRMSKRARL